MLPDIAPPTQERDALKNPTTLNVGGQQINVGEDSFLRLQHGRMLDDDQAFLVLLLITAGCLDLPGSRVCLLRLDIVTRLRSIHFEASGKATKTDQRQKIYSRLLQLPSLAVPNVVTRQQLSFTRLLVS